MAARIRSLSAVTNTSSGKPAVSREKFVRKAAASCTASYPQAMGLGKIYDTA